MKSQQKMTVTLAMIWIGAMALLSTPEWIRAARDFVGQSTTPKTVANAGGASGSSGGGGAALSP